MCYTENWNDCNMYGDQTEVYGEIEVPDMGELDNWARAIRLSQFGPAYSAPTGHVILFKDTDCKVGYSGIFEEGRHD